MSVLVLVEHGEGKPKDATLATVTAAAKLGEVHALVAGSGAETKQAADATARIAGVAKVLLAAAPAYGQMLAENVAALIVSLMPGYDALLACATSNGKNVAPRVAALLDVMQLSEILSVEGADTFTRPTYAGNAIATVQSGDAKKVITVRGTAFEKAAATGGSATVEAVSGGGDPGGHAAARPARRAAAMALCRAGGGAVDGGAALGRARDGGRRARRARDTGAAAPRPATLCRPPAPAGAR